MNVPAGTGTQRGLGGAIGGRIIKVIGFRIGEYVGKKAKELVADWEASNRPNGVRTFDLASHAVESTYLQADDPKWRELSNGRALLWVHGTFSRTQQGFGHVDEDVLKSLATVYGNRMFAFDHATMSVSPEDNARWFIDHIPAGVRLELDIVCHSRGGLVSRMLAERGSQLGGTGKLTVKRIVLVAAPNEGTILADVNHWNSLLDTVSTIYSLAGGPGLGDLLESVLALVRQIVVAGYEQISGLASMAPGSKLLDGLNEVKRDGLTYLGIGSNFEAPPGGLAILDEALDLIHGGPNDMLVRTDSAVGKASIGGARFAPPDEEILLDGNGAVDHAGYFIDASLMASVRDWLAHGLAS